MPLRTTSASLVNNQHLPTRTLFPAISYSLSLSSMADKKKKRRRDDDDEEALVPFKNRLKADDAIIQILKALSAEAASSSSSKTLTLADLALSSSCREVSELSLSSVQASIESLVLRLAHSILAGDGFALSVPSRSAANQLYVPELDRIVLKEKCALRPFAAVSTVRKTTVTARILQLIHQLCLKSIHVTKRDLFYTDVKLFQVLRKIWC